MKLFVAVCWIAGPALFAADTGARFYQARLISPLASYHEAGTPFTARIVGPMRTLRQGQLPAGTLLQGRIRDARSIGIGLRRERAALALEFLRCEWKGEPIPCTVNLVSVDNAREKVTEGNRIKGVLAASHPNRWWTGAWIRPVPALVRRAPTGLSGPLGALHTKLPPNPAIAVAMVGLRLALFQLPEPEIQLPAGTDLIVKVVAEPPPSAERPLAVLFDPAPSEPPEPRDPLMEELRRLPPDVHFAGRSRAMDVINFAFVASRAEVEQAFEAAGWVTAEPLTAKTFMRTYRAASSLTTYPKAPVSPLYHQGRLPDLVYQKSFNSLAKRHHIRLWPVEVAGRQVWLGAATHDIAVSFDWNRMSLTHRIDPHIDRERSIVLNDLTDAGCVESVTVIERPAVRRERARGTGITDGALFVPALRSCLASQLDPGLPGKVRRPLVIAATRRVILESRYYLTRGNPYYWAFQMVRSGADARKYERYDAE
jgi:hypothetical protein